MLGRTNSAGGGAIVGEKSIYANGTYNASSDDLDGYSSVIVNVPSTLKTLLDARQSASYLFYNYNGSSVDGLIFYDDTSEVTNMNNMFLNCSNLTSVPLLDTGKVTNTSYMFYGCTKLTSIPLFDTSEVTNMVAMLQSCSQLTSVPLFNISKVTDMGNMLRSCGQLTSVPAFNVENVANMGHMLTNCSSVTSILMYNIKADLNVSPTALQHDALVVLIGNLYDFVSAGETGTHTLTMGATKLGYLSQEEKDVATAKGWTLA